jgi:type I restriction enzyme R subunit
MLDTGIDVPEVVNPVFFKIVRSKTKLWQMIGRGTRLRPDLFGPNRPKDQFLIFDFCQNFEFFNQNPKMTDGAVGVSLGQRLFASRVELIGLIDSLPEGERPEGVGMLRDGTQTRLFDEVKAMSLDNFIVRTKRRAVEHFQVKEVWDNLSGEDRQTLIDDVAGLPTALVDDDIAARQFDYLVLSGQLALLKKDVSFKSFQNKVIALASRLEELSNVPMVAAEMALIIEVQTDEYWQDITPWLPERLRRHLRLLVKLIEGDTRRIIYTGFEDEIGVGEDIGLPSVSVGTDKARFQMKVRHFLAGHADHITIQKLRRNEQLTPQDIAELERILIEEAVTSKDDLANIRTDGGLGLFIRSLTGLERDAAKNAFAAFIDGRTLGANQIEFINLIIDHLTERGAMDPRRLYESPFTDLADQGVSGIFQQADVQKIVGVLNSIRGRAAA